MVRKPSTSYCIHCDLVDQHQNLLNEKPSNLLAKFDIKGIPFEKVYYEAGKHVLHDASSGEYNTWQKQYGLRQSHYVLKTVTVNGKVYHVLTNQIGVVLKPSQTGKLYPCE